MTTRTPLVLGLALGAALAGPLGWHLARRLPQLPREQARGGEVPPHDGPPFAPELQHVDRCDTGEPDHFGGIVVNGIPFVIELGDGETFTLDRPDRPRRL